MELKLKNLLPLAGLVSASLFGQAFADSTHYGSSSREMSDEGNYQRGTYREITPNAGPRVSNGADVFVTANFIWWKVTQDGLNLSTTGYYQGNSSADADVEKGKINNLKGSWEPGFKVGLGMNLGHDGWDVFAQYTWINASRHSTQKGSVLGLEFVPFISSAGPMLTNIEKVDSHNKLHFNVIDLELGRDFYVSQFLSLRPHLGLKGSWQNHDTRVKYFRSSNDPFQIPVEGGKTVNASGPYMIHQSQDNYGVGVRTGLDTSWFITKNWSIYGKFAGTAMWTAYEDVKREDKVNNTATEVAKTTVDVKFNHYTVKWVAELELGAKADWWFSNDDYHLGVQAGWEEQIWVNYGSNIDLSSPEAADFNVHGLNLKFRFDF